VEGTTSHILKSWFYLINQSFFRAAFTPQKKSQQCPVNRRLGRRFGEGGNLLVLPELEALFVRHPVPVALAELTCGVGPHLTQTAYSPVAARCPEHPPRVILLP
jgi:hypothetical protein